MNKHKLMVMSSARVSPSPTDGDTTSGDLSEQEKDLLDRSKKKPKVTMEATSCHETIVEETLLTQTSPVEVESTRVVPCKGVEFQTAIGMGLQRKMVSYKDVCLGVNGHNVSEEDAFFFDAENPMVEEDGGTKGDHAGDNGFLGDPLCPVVRLSNEEREMIRTPWKRSLLVKVLGKRMGLRYFQARLYKMWQPKFRMEVIGK
ncbi:hypothetical protein SESBI_00185 [Sesbania bispinosa]|nr:hypothetical protein SESBI_00185 [Sesbania bispinosa]